MRLAAPARPIRAALPRALPSVRAALSRLARLGGVRIADESGRVPAGAAARPDGAPRGSGSWANDWAPFARAAGLRPPAPDPEDRAADGEAPAADAPLMVRPLLDGASIRLQTWLGDRLEEEAPTCSLHAGVALGAFLRPAQGEAPEIADLAVDLLVADAAMRPRLALVRRGTRPAAAEATLVAALGEAGVPVVHPRPRVPYSRLWGAIRPHLPEPAAAA